MRALPVGQGKWRACTCTCTRTGHIYNLLPSPPLPLRAQYTTGRPLIHDMEYLPGNASCGPSVALAHGLRIDHYALKSREDYENKMKR